MNTPITTPEPAVTVDAGLPVGRHRFRLEVIDTAGLRSRPDETIVEVQRIIIDPTPVGPTPIPIPTPGPIGPIRTRPQGDAAPPPGTGRPRGRRHKEKP